LARKRGHEEDAEIMDDDEMDDEESEEETDSDEEDDDDEDDTIALDEAEEEEEEDDDEDEDEEDAGESVEKIERRRLFQNESEELLENLTLEDVKEVLRENDLEEGLAPRLKKLLAEVINEGEVDNLDDAWDEALERLEE
jgi:hypothetical protein